MILYNWTVSCRTRTRGAFTVIMSNELGKVPFKLTVTVIYNGRTGLPTLSIITEAYREEILFI